MRIKKKQLFMLYVQKHSGIQSCRDINPDDQKKYRVDPLFIGHLYQAASNQSMRVFVLFFTSIKRPAPIN